jgi:hypothetical protein
MGGISDEEIERLRQWAQWGVDLSNRSRARAATLKAGTLHVAVMGALAPNVPLVALGGVLGIRSVTDAPGAVHLAGKARDGDGGYLAIARYATGVACEIVFFDQVEHPMDGEMQHHLCWHLAALLKIRGHQLQCPASASLPWDLIAGAENGSVDFRILDDQPTRIVLRPPMKVTPGDVAWCDQHFMAAMQLRGVKVSRRFGLAFNLAYTWNLSRDYRVALTLLWAGLEALFGDQTDRPVTANLATRIAAWVPNTTDAHVRSLYATRCDAVHGRDLTASGASQAMIETERLLQDALRMAIEQGRVPLPDWPT